MHRLLSMVFLVFVMGLVAAASAGATVDPLVTVSGASPQARLRAVTRIQRRDGAGWNPKAL